MEAARHEAPEEGAASRSSDPDPPAALAGLLDELGPERRRQVLAHRSWAPLRVDSYERLELLGDSVLQLVVTAELMRRHPEAGEGDLSWMRQAVVAREYCAAAARASGLAGLMVAGAPHAHRERARELAEATSVQAATAEAVIGAAWLDLGHERAERAVLAAFAPALDAARPGMRDPKTALQEEAQRRRLAVAYELTEAEGPPQERTFASRALVDGRELGRGRGRSKQASEVAAAAEALRRLVESG